MLVLQIPPQESSFYTSDKFIIFDRLEHDIEKYSKSGNVIIMGDLNSRTGQNSDMIPKSKNDEIFFLEDEQ